MVNVKDIFSGDYLNVERLKELELIGKVLVIVGTTTEEIQGKKKLIVVLEGVEEFFAPNKTNAMLIADKLGNETEAWKGKGIKLNITKVMFSGKMTPSMLVTDVIEKV